MPRFTESFDMSDEVDALDAMLDELADQQVELERQLEDAEEDNREAIAAEYRSVSQRADDVEQAYVGACWAVSPDDREDRDPIDQITLGALTAAEDATPADRVTTLADQKRRRGWGKSPRLERARKIEYAAAFIVDAPFLDEDAGHEEIVAALDDAAAACPQFVDWIVHRGDDLTTPPVEGNAYEQRVAERR